ncbi:hypothetical protein PHAMO_210266 [Magnetospirillum molischianum DSM 120]|uniref:Uncharacterized protein n=1 Tax=Magnetospirillum molischianum DSM 120 TaxID=1150626 RepID=H8FQW7_MAGML|nr:hypothetical protein PHAMO_210266 [Magnetospirillum molischianum DSM 120]
MLYQAELHSVACEALLIASSSSAGKGYFSLFYKEGGDPPPAGFDFAPSGVLAIVHGTTPSSQFARRAPDLRRQTAVRRSHRLDWPWRQDLSGRSQRLGQVHPA